MASLQSSSRSRRRRSKAEINVVPYIDVMLVLLVIFMVTAPFVNPSVVELPSVGKASPQQQATPLEVIIKADGRTYMRLREPGVPETAADVETIIAEARRVQAARPDTPVVISGDKNVKYDTVIQVMGGLQRADVKRVALNVLPKP
ncbi:protein TolR [Derxia gummosa]|uniref:Protein TolR n=1 Tax=Derxia gummosa DSM 723 TaxID=1121388 RepID=A0A8B6X5R0_9BURK|nr:protein TolR [Derxia gummosa]